MKPTVFVSFDYDNDKHYKYLLEAWHSNPKFQFVFDDGTPSEIDSTNVGRIKAALTSKIKDATHTLVIVGQHSNDLHSKYQLIGYRNWINFEIAKSIELKKRIAVIKIDRSYTSPEQLSGANPSWGFSFTEDNVIKALDTAPYPGLFPLHRNV
jgi:hypothetical protein